MPNFFLGPKTCTHGSATMTELFSLLLITDSEMEMKGFAGLELPHLAGLHACLAIRGQLLQAPARALLVAAQALQQVAAGVHCTDVHACDWAIEPCARDSHATCMTCLLCSKLVSTCSKTVQS